VPMIPPNQALLWRRLVPPIGAAPLFLKRRQPCCLLVADGCVFCAVA